MPKPKPPARVRDKGGGRHPSTITNKHHKTRHMDKVKIKRAKKFKKPVTTKEKILAGLGVGGALMGGMAAMESKPSQDATRFIRTQNKEGSAAAGKIRQTLNNIFAIERAQATGLDVGAVEGDSGVTGSDALLTLDNTDVSVAAGATDTVNASVDNAGTADFNVSVSSADQTVATATVDTTTGIITITGISAGTTSITVHPVDSGSDTSTDQTINVTVGSAASTGGSGSGGGSGVGTTEGDTVENSDSADTSGTNTNPTIETDTTETTDQSTDTTTDPNAPGQVEPGAGETTDSTTDDNTPGAVENTGGEATDNSTDSTGNSTDVGNVEIAPGENTDSGAGSESPAAVTLSLSETSVTAGPGQSEVVNVYMTGAAAVAGHISAVSSNPAVARVSVDAASGNVTITGVSAGSATITVHPTDMGTDTSADKTISVTIIAVQGGGAASTGSGSSSGSYYSYGNGQVAAYQQSGGNQSGATQGLQMPAGYDASSGGLAYQGLQNQQSGNNGYSSGQVQGNLTAAQTYTVKKGDTLWNISKKFYGDGRQWRTILSANPASLSRAGNVRTLKIGYELNIPGGSYNAGQAQTQGLSSAFQTVTPTGPTYTVKRGDTLSAIASAYYNDSSKWPQIMAANAAKVSSPRTLRIGTVLTIPGASAGAADTFASAAAQTYSPPAQVQNYQAYQPVINSAPASNSNPASGSAPIQLRSFSQTLKASDLTSQGNPPAQTGTQDAATLNLGQVEGGSEVAE